MLKKLIGKVEHALTCLIVKDPDWRLLFCSCPKCRRVSA